MVSEIPWLNPAAEAQGDLAGISGILTMPQAEWESSQNEHVVLWHRLVEARSF